MRRITEVHARNFRSLADVKVPLGPFSVLIGPNGSGKSNVLNVIRFLSDTAERDLQDTVAAWGGLERLKRASPGLGAEAHVVIGIEGLISEHSSQGAVDDYSLQFWETKARGLARKEELLFKRLPGRGRRISVSGSTFTLSEDESSDSKKGTFRSKATTALATLPRYSVDEGGQGIADIADFLRGMVVFEPDVDAIRQPTRLRGGRAGGAISGSDTGSGAGRLLPDASNLGPFLIWLREHDSEAFDGVVADLKDCLMGAESIQMELVSGSSLAVEVQVCEDGLNRGIPLADASWGTVRLIALLAILHHPQAYSLIAIEELDAGLHPYALDLLVRRMREASDRTQLIIASHSPTLVNRLDADEMIICERDPDTGASIIPSLSKREILEALEQAPDFQPGELWFSGALGGVPE